MTGTSHPERVRRCRDCDHPITPADTFERDGMGRPVCVDCRNSELPVCDMGDALAGVGAYAAFFKAATSQQEGQ